MAVFEPRVDEHTRLDHITFFVDVVFKYLNKLKAKTSKGPDCLPAIFLKKMAHRLALPFSLLFSRSFESSEVLDV